jgi:hypothetical protein
VGLPSVLNDLNEAGRLRPETSVRPGLRDLIPTG